MSFTPVSEFSLAQREDIDLATLGLEAQALFDQSTLDHEEGDNLEGSTQQLLATLVAVGSSGGARPKAQIYMPAGYGKAPPLKMMQKLATTTGFATWKKAQQCIQGVVDAISQFSNLAEQHAISKTTVLSIENTLAQRKQENAALLV